MTAVELIEQGMPGWPQRRCLEISGSFLVSCGRLPEIRQHPSGRKKGKGTREKGQGKRDKGKGTRETGKRIMAAVSGL